MLRWCDGSLPANVMRVAVPIAKEVGSRDAQSLQLKDGAEFVDLTLRGMQLLARS